MQGTSKWTHAFQPNSSSGCLGVLALTAKKMSTPEKRTSQFCGSRQNLLPVSGSPHEAESGGCRGAATAVWRVPFDASCNQKRTAQTLKLRISNNRAIWSMLLVYIIWYNYQVSIKWHIYILFQVYKCVGCSTVAHYSSTIVFMLNTALGFNPECVLFEFGWNKSTGSLPRLEVECYLNIRVECYLVMYVNVHAVQAKISRLKLCESYPLTR